MRHRSPALGLALVLALVPGPTRANGDEAADPACAQRAVDLAQQRYEAVRDLRARFVQTSHSLALGSGPAGSTTSSGQVVFAKPGRMRWSYEKPEPSLVVSDGQTLSIYDPSRRELQRLPVAEGFLSGTAIQFLLGEGDLRSAFEIVSLACGPDAADVELLPLKPASYERLRMRIDASRGDVVRTTVVDLLGNRTEIELSDIQVDVGADPDLFRFQPPEGVRVIELDPSGGEP